jgi:hypothetical protein
VLEGGQHLEASWEQNIGPRLRYEAALFHDMLREIALSMTVLGGNETTSRMLRDPFSDRFFVSGGSAAGLGGRVAVAGRVSEDSEIIVGYSYGAGLQADAAGILLNGAEDLREQVRRFHGHTIMVGASTAIPWSQTRVAASYRWLPRGVVAVIDPYDRGMSRAEPYLNLFVLQPIPSPEILPGQFEAVADFSNLLAQGYLPVLTAGGGSGYLFPVARAFRGGFNFTF